MCILTSLLNFFNGRSNQVPYSSRIQPHAQYARYPGLTFCTQIFLNFFIPFFLFYIFNHDFLLTEEKRETVSIY